MILHRVFFRLGETLAFDGDDMQQLRPLRLAQISQHFGEREDIVSVDGPGVIKSERLKESAGGQGSLDSFPRLLGHFQGGREQRKRQPSAFARAVGGGTGKHAGEMISQRADRRGDGHFIVVQHHQQVGFRRGAGVVEGLKGHPAGHRPVPHHGGDAAVFILEFGGGGHSESGGNGGAGMPGAEAVMRIFVAGEESGDAPPFADGFQLFAPSSEDFVRVGLMPDIPDDPVIGRLISAMQRDGEFNRAEVGGEMPPHAKNGLNDERAGLVGEFRQPRARQRPHISRRFNAMKKFQHWKGNHNINAPL